MQKQGKESQIYRIEKLLISICRDEASKVKSRTETLHQSICRKEGAK